jgi:hypothetical protein
VERIHGDRRGFVQNARRFFGLRVYECRACGHRFYDWPTK